MTPPPAPTAGASLAMISTALPISTVQPKDTTAATSDASRRKTSDATRPRKPPMRGTHKRRACPLPRIKDHSWEGKADGAWESWHAPAKARERRERVYLGRVGKRLLKTWLALPRAERLTTVEAWIAKRRREKGIG